MRFYKTTFVLKFWNKKIRNKLCFNHIISKEIKRIIKDTNTKTATQKGNLPVEVIKENVGLFPSYKSQMLNLYHIKVSFKFSKWTQAWKNKQKIIKKLISIKNIFMKQKACNFTKSNTPPWVFFKFFKFYKWYQIAQRITSFIKSREQWFYEQRYDHFNGMLSNIHYEFRRGFSTQHSLMAMIEKWRWNLDKRGSSGTYTILHMKR